LTYSITISTHVIACFPITPVYEPVTYTNKPIQRFYLLHKGSRSKIKVCTTWEIMRTWIWFLIFIG